MSTSDQHVSLSSIKPVHWIVIVVTLILVGLGIWQSMLPLLAERRFRDGYNFHQRQRYRFAVEELQQAVKYAPWETHYQIQLGRSMEEYAKSKPREEQVAINYELEKLYLKMISLDDNNPWYRARLASVYDRLAKLLPEQKERYVDLALEANRASAAVDPQNPLFQLNLAYYLHRRYDPALYDEAIKHYKLVKSMDNRMAEAAYNLADLYRRQGKIEASLAEYMEILEVRPDFPNVHLATATTLLALGKESEALPHFEQALKGKQSREEVLKNIAAIYYRKNQWEMAERFYARLFNEFPKTIPDLHIYYVQSLVGSKKFDAADQALTRYLNAHPNDKTAQQQRTLLDDFRRKATK